MFWLIRCLYIDSQGEYLDAFPTMRIAPQRGWSHALLQSLICAKICQGGLDGQMTTGKGGRRRRDNLAIQQDGYSAEP